jgi:hypothetical protein
LLRIALGFENNSFSYKKYVNFGDRYITHSKRLFKAFLEGFYDKSRSTFPKKSDVFYLTHTTCRMIKVNHLWFDVFFSPLIEWTAGFGLEKAFYGEEFAPNSEYRLPRFDKTNFIEKKVCLYSLSARLFPRNDLGDEQIQMLSAICHLVSSKGGTAVCLDSFRVVRTLRSFLSHKRRFQKILEVVEPKLVFVVTYYGMPGMALMQAANEKGILTVDLQHGIQGALHLAYGQWSRLPDSGWYMLPRIFWNWTQDDVENINSWGQERHEGILGGNILMQYVLEADCLDESTARLKEKIKLSGKKRVVLATLQPGGAEWFDELLGAIGDSRLSNIFWLVRLHPGMATERSSIVSLIENTFCDVSDATDAPLPYVLQLIDLHITSHSSVTIEAGMVGVRTLLGRGCEYYVEWVTRGFASCLGEGESMACGVERILCQEHFLENSVNVSLGATMAKSALQRLLTRAHHESFRK